MTDNAGASASVTKAVTVTVPAQRAADGELHVHDQRPDRELHRHLHRQRRHASPRAAGASATATTSTATNPSKTYAAAGTYSVVLTVTDNVGATASVTKSVTVTAAPPPSNVLTKGVPVTGLAGSSGTERRYTMAVPSGATNLTFTIAGGTGDADLYVRFGSAPTTSAYDCRPYLDGNNETCTFATRPGRHLPRHGARVLGVLRGCSLTGNYSGGVANVAPTASFSFTTSGLTASFTDTSTDSDGSDRVAQLELRRRHDLHRDQSEQDLRGRRHLQRHADRHRQRRGERRARPTSVTVTGAPNVPPTANFSFTTSGLTASFTDTSTDSDGTIASRSWSFGDATTSTATNPSKTYAAANTYDVTLTVTDNVGASASVTKSVTVTAPANVAPTANFTFTTSGLTASFTDTSADSDGSIASRSWNFGDGSTSTATNPSKTYASAGTYSVMLNVADNVGATASVTKSVTVTAAPPPSNTLTNGVPVTGLAGSSGTELRYTMVGSLRRHQPDVHHGRRHGRRRSVRALRLRADHLRLRLPSVSLRQQRVLHVPDAAGRHLPRHGARIHGVLRSHTDRQVLSSRDRRACGIGVAAAPRAACRDIAFRAA